MPDWLQTLIDYAGKHHEGIAALDTLLGGAVVAVLFLAKHVFALLFRNEKKDSEGKAVVHVATLDLATIRELLATVPRTESGGTDSSVARATAKDAETVTEQQVLDASATLSRFRSLLSPATSLTPEAFPLGSRLIKFKPGRLILIACEATGMEKGCIAAFSVLYWPLFPGFGGYFIGQVGGQRGATIGACVGAAIGLANWWRLSRRGPYIRINLRKQTYALMHAAAFSWRKGLPEAEVETVCEDGRWIARARIADCVVVTKTSTESRNAAEGTLTAFVRALNWEMGKRISVSEGVYIEPPKRGRE